MKKSEFILMIKEELKSSFNQLKKIHEANKLPMPDEFITTGLTLTQDSVIKSFADNSEGRFALLEYSENLKAFKNSLKAVAKAGKVDYTKLSMLMDLKKADVTTKAIKRSNEIEKDFVDDVSSLMSYWELKKILKRAVKFSLAKELDSVDFVDKMVDDIFAAHLIHEGQEFSQEDAEKLFEEILAQAMEPKNKDDI